MNELPSLTWIERMALWILIRSPRTSLVVIKEHFWPGVFTAVDPRDPTVAHVAGGQDDPPSLQLERIYHLPAYGELE